MNKTAELSLIVASLLIVSPVAAHEVWGDVDDTHIYGYGIVSGTGEGNYGTNFDFVNYCPCCGKYGTLAWNPKNVAEGEITCAKFNRGCSADFSVSGMDKKEGGALGYLTIYYEPGQQEQKENITIVQQPKTELEMLEEILSQNTLLGKI